MTEQTKTVGIAKELFCKFYESKQMLFFAVLANIPSELYGVADHALSEAAATVRGLTLTVSRKEQIGKLYPQVYDACRELFE